MEATFVLIRPVRPPPKVWSDNRKHLESHFDQKSLDHYQALVKRTQIHRTADFTFSILRIIVVRSGIASNKWWIVSRTEFNGCKRFEQVWRQLCVTT